MNRLAIATAALSIVINISCSGSPTVEPTGSSLTYSIVPAAFVTSASTAPAQVVTGPGAFTTSGAVGPLLSGAQPCFADRYPCETYDFSLVRPGPIEVMVTWDGPPRALLVQLYWAGEGLAHEDVAPREGPSRIWFRRPLMEATSYRLRVVSLEPGYTIPFTLTLTY